MHRNTIRTLLGYWRSLLAKHLPFLDRSAAIADIYNRIAISENLNTSGQPTEAQFGSIQREGFTTVINLAPHDAENALPDEAGLISRLGMRYIHIPVDFKNPTDTDFQRFVQAMAATSGSKTWVHCAANMRVSAFIYRYRREVLAEEEAPVHHDLQRIWAPQGVWKDFIASKTSSKGR